MKKIITLCSIGFLLWSCQKGGTTTVEGVVIDKDTKQPVSGVKIKLVEENLPGIFSMVKRGFFETGKTVTDKEGKYAFTFDSDTKHHYYVGAFTDNPIYYALFKSSFNNKIYDCYRINSGEKNKVTIPLFKAGYIKAHLINDSKVDSTYDITLKDFNIHNKALVIDTFTKSWNYKADTTAEIHYSIAKKKIAIDKTLKFFAPKLDTLVFEIHF
ncbi:MAG: hypothetical protein NTX03_13360 [Bacteroidetes bacterium]|nr:hypothetical protein [Bacteroidota bacterium]